MNDVFRFVRPAGVDGVEALHARFSEHRYEPHIHETWTVAWVNAGTAMFDLERGYHVVHDGRGFLIPPGRVHTGTPGPNGTTYSVLYLDPFVLNQLTGDERPPPMDAREVIFNDRRVAHTLVIVHQLLQSPDVLAHGEAVHFAMRALSMLLLPVRTPEPRRPERAAVRRARDLIDEMPAAAMPLAVLARHAGLSPSRLVDAFKHDIGMTPHAYQRAARLEIAKRLLRRGEPPAIAAAESGFFDQAHLTRTFKRFTGVTPARYATGE
ncbi:MAG TPA: AraC family transcriptional regulator [Solirubrobacteraceae bacterium]|nr:AraC family transcriptional regulator [Solirubrobacteraceae bacterium]